MNISESKLLSRNPGCKNVHVLYFLTVKKSNYFFLRIIEKCCGKLFNKFNKLYINLLLGLGLRLKSKFTNSLISNRTPYNNNSYQCQRLGHFLHDQHLSLYRFKGKKLNNVSNFHFSSRHGSGVRLMPTEAMNWNFNLRKAYQFFCAFNPPMPCDKRTLGHATCNHCSVQGFFVRMTSTHRIAFPMQCAAVRKVPCGELSGKYLIIWLWRRNTFWAEDRERNELAAYRSRYRKHWHNQQGSCKLVICYSHYCCVAWKLTQRSGTMLPPKRIRLSR